eukprot:6022675-Alexandrium_andersonii.AAC.1
MALVTRSASLVNDAAAVAELRSLFPAGTLAAAAEAQQLDDSTVEQLVQAVQKAIVQAPRRSGPGPNGSRFEHWKTLLADSTALDANARVVVAFLLGRLPADFTQANLGARLLALRKKNGRLRPVACGSVLRRLAAKAACEVFKDELAEACGPHQYAVGRRAGCELVHKCVSSLAEALPGATVLAFDASNAFNTLPRQAVLDALRQRAPRLLPVANAWLTRETAHVFWDGGGAAHPVRAQAGVDQGCPLSPAFFAIGIAGALAQADVRLRQLHPAARLFSYLDDVLVVAPASCSRAAHDV